jgi:hypothetical protein
MIPQYLGSWLIDSFGEHNPLTFVEKTVYTRISMESRRFQTDKTHCRPNIRRSASVVIETFFLHLFSLENCFVLGLTAVHVLKHPERADQGFVPDCPLLVLALSLLTLAGPVPEGVIRGKRPAGLMFALSCHISM